MNIKELKNFLEQYPGDLEIVNERYSDYEIITPEDFTIVQGVKNSGWVMRSHPTMSAENKAAEKSYLLLRGN